MANERIVEPSTQSENDLIKSVKTYFTHALANRKTSGAYQDLIQGYIHEHNYQKHEFEGPYTTYVELNQNGGECGCNESEGDAACNICKPGLENVCDLGESITDCASRSPFDNLCELLISVKEYEYTALIENALAPVGDKPFKLEANRDFELGEGDCSEIAQGFYEYIQSVLDENQVTVDEIPDAFNLNSLTELTDQLATSAKNRAGDRQRDAVRRNEDVIELIFQRSNYMREYKEVIRDTRHYPFGVMWIDDNSLKKNRKIKDGKLTFDRQIQCDVERVDPCYAWFTDDFTRHKQGTAAFRLKQYTLGDLKRWLDKDLGGSDAVNDSLELFIDQNPDGHKEYQAMMFRREAFLNKSLYDVVICRGQFDVKQLKSLGVDIPDIHKEESYVPCEIYFAGSSLLRVRVMKCIDDLGVYTTRFRQNGDNLAGYSLRQFIYPFAKLYQGAVDKLDTSSGKATGSVIQIDTSVIDNPDQALNKNEKTGELELDWSGDTVIEFDSTRAAMMSPNFRGVPITVTQLPNDMAKVSPLLDVVFTQLERITGIPTILVNANNVSSALRTTESFNLAFEASSKVVQTLLREGLDNVMEPSIRFIFDSKAMSGDMKDFLAEAEPKILLADEINRQFNDDRQHISALSTLAPFAGVMPQESLASLINLVGRRAFNLDEDLIPGVDAALTNNSSNAASVS